VAARRDPEDSTFDYSVGTERQAAFEADIRRYWPGCRRGRCYPAYSGIRPKLAARASRRPTSASTARPGTASPAW
jgi:hypothetical protein